MNVSLRKRNLYIPCFQTLVHRQADLEAVIRKEIDDDVDQFLCAL